MNELSIIWNVTRLCSWKCKFCCVNAIPVEGKVDCSNSNNLSKVSNYEELSYEEKIRIIDQLESGKYKIDFSGGELLIDPQNIDLILYASERLGADKVGISISGAFVDDKTIKKLQNKVRDIELTLDFLPYEYYKLRPVGYHESAGYTIKRLKEAGFYVGVQTVLTKENISRSVIANLAKWVEDNNVDEWSLLRFFPSGRGKHFTDLVPTYEEYCEVVDYIKLVTEESQLAVHFQYLLPNHDNYTFDCRAVKKSIGILPDGTVTCCFWALDEKMYPKDDMFLLGKLPEDHIVDLLKSPKAKFWKEQAHTCKLFNQEILEKVSS